MAFKPATKETARLRMAIDGPSGSGKTFTGLTLAAAIAGPKGKVAVIDSERGSASKYADKFRFIVDEMTSHHPQAYIDAIHEAGKMGVSVLLIDSLSHAWMGKDGALEQVDKAAARSQSGNSFAAWREVTPLHNKLVDAILQAPMHIIVTMRSKMEYVLEEQDRGGRKVTVPKKVGMAPVQREGLEYEFDVVGDMDQQHRMVISKTRCSDLSGAVLERPGAELAQVLVDWLNGPTADDALVYVQAEADNCFTPEDLTGLKKLLQAKGGAYFTDAAKAILRARFEAIAPPAPTLATAEQAAAAEPAPAPAAAQVQPAAEPTPAAETLHPQTPPPEIDPETGEPYTPGIAAARAVVRKEIEHCKTEEELDALARQMQKSAGAYLSAKVSILLTEARAKVADSLKAVA